MKLDFKKLQSSVTSDTTHSPRDLFNLLSKKAKRYSYLRDVQADVLEQWAARRDVHDLTIKMNTGSGKTVVGLLILKSCLNEKKGPAVYIAPTPQLIQQVLDEAKDLGIEVTNDTHSPRFLSGNAILVVNVYKLINGMSVFGVGDEGIKISIGSLVIDDAHSCLETAEEQFTLNLPRIHASYHELLELFEHDLELQSSSGLLDLKAQDPHKSMLVPFWAWADKQKAVQKILRKYQDDQELKFVMPLIKEDLALCRCAFSAKAVEIAPRCLPIRMIPSFGAAQRRIFMSATFRDDSILVTHFDADAKSVAEVIRPASGGDIGDRMILVPQEANPFLTDDQLKVMLKDLSLVHNVVVIVPSEYRAKYWEDVAVDTLNSKNLAEGVKSLQAGHQGLLVLVNKYDGIDLPDEACRVLVIDGLPDVRRTLDKIDQAALSGSSAVVGQAIQRIEQGMGRGIRSKDDYCAVILMGRSLTSQLYAHNAVTSFTTATRAQLELSSQMGVQLRGGTAGDFKGAIESFLARDEDWISVSRAAVVGAEYGKDVSLSPGALNVRRAFNLAVVGNFQGAVDEIQETVAAQSNARVKAWYKVELAEYQYHVDPAKAQETLASAIASNNQLTRPLAGTQYVRMQDLTHDQAALCIGHLRDKFPNPNALILHVNEMVETLAFIPGTASLFERTLAAAAGMLGFAGQCPESDSGVGPDVLWSMGKTQFLVIECKNGATTSTINKHDCNQLNGSIIWFENKYGATCSATPIMVHPSRVFERACSPDARIRIMNKEHLAKFCDALSCFAKAVAQLPKYGTAADVSRLLQYGGLTRGAFADTFSTTHSTKL